MKRKTFFRLWGGLLAAQLSLLIRLPSPLTYAIEPEPTPQVVVIKVVSTPEPVAIRVVEIREYDNDRAEIETLARLLWSSPLLDETQKRVLLWVTLNRVGDPGDLFGTSISAVVNAREFTFYDDDAHLSDENLRIANDVMNAWKSEKAGCYVGPHVPPEGLYIRFIGENNRAIEATAEKGGAALVW